MKPRAKKCLVLVAVYSAVWIATWIGGPRLLKRQLYVSGDGTAYEPGSQVSVRLEICPLPLIMKVKCTPVGGLDGYGTAGWYFTAPWKVYGIGKQLKWIS